jgi:hypothetical protein
MLSQKILAVALVVTLAGCDKVSQMTTANVSAEPAVAVKLRPSQTLGPMWKILEITAKDDKVSVSGVVGNRGNCQIDYGKDKLPIDLAFGETMGVGVAGCELIEATVKTSKGDFSFGFK